MLTSVVMTRRSQMHNFSVILRSCCGPSTAVLKRSQQIIKFGQKKKKTLTCMGYLFRSWFECHKNFTRRLSEDGVFSQYINNLRGKSLLRFGNEIYTCELPCVWSFYLAFQVIAESEEFWKISS